MLEVKLIFEFFNLTDILKKQKSVINISLINYWFKLRRAFFKPKNFVCILKEYQRRWFLAGNPLLFHRVAQSLLNCLPQAPLRLHILPILDTCLTRLRALPIINTRFNPHQQAPYTPLSCLVLRCYSWKERYILCVRSNEPLTSRLSMLFFLLF